MKKILPEWPSYDQNLINAINKIIISGKVNYHSGSLGKKFESLFSNYTKTKYCLAVSNGTVAIEMALKVFDFKKNDEIIVTPRSFIASASSVVNVNLKPLFADVNLNTQNIDLETIKKIITKKTKAIICVHLAGYPCDMKEICAFAKKNNIKVIEDCSQAHGAKINGKPIGSFGDISTWSFCNDKIISTLGEGGMVATNNRKYFLKMWSLRDHGKEFSNFFKANSSNKFRYIHDNFGSNYRMTEIQSISGIFQLNKLDKIIIRKNKLAKLITDKLSDIPSINMTNFKKNYTHSFYRFYFKINYKYLPKKITIKKILLDLNSEQFNIFGSGACPEIYKERAFKKILNKKIIHKNALSLGKNSICFPIHPNYNLTHIKLIINKIKKTFDNYVC